VDVGSAWDAALNGSYSVVDDEERRRCPAVTVPADEGRTRLGQDPGMAARVNLPVIVGSVFAPVGLVLLGVAAALAVSSANF